MKYKLSLLLATIPALLITSCHNNTPQDSNLSISPEAGTTFKAGDAVSVKAHYSPGTKPDSVVYLVDSVKVGSKPDSAALSLKTDSMPLGPRVITARLYQGGKSQEASTNIVLLPAKAPEDYTYKVIKVYPHDTSCYTEGLLYQDGFLYESGGGYADPPAGLENDGQSSLRKEDLNTGKILLKAMVDPKVFAEGISIVGDKLIQLTWTSKIAYIYDKNTFKLLKTIPNNVGVEGWGMCFDGKKLYMDDKTNRIWFLNKDTYQSIGYIDVYDEHGAVDSVNELEYINGKLYANVYTKDYILEIDPKTGAVLKRINMQNIWPQSQRPLVFDSNNNVLNGIAYDAAGKRIFVTGKKWPHLYQVEFVKK